MRKLLRSRWPLFATPLVAIAAGVWLRCGPIPAELLREDDQPSTLVVDRHGHALYEARSTGGTPK